MDLRAIASGIAFAFIWASAFTSGRIIVTAAPPLIALSVRFLVSGVIGVGLAWAMGQSWRLTRGQWRAVLIFGICQNALYLGLNFVAMQWIGASVAAIIASSMPLMVALAGWLVFGERLRPLGIAGLVAGVAGVGLIMGSRLSGGTDPAGILLCLVGAVALTVATLAVRGVASGGNVMMVVGLQMFVGAAILSVAAALTESWQVDWSWRLGAAFAYTTLVPGVLATWIWLWLVGRIGAIRASTFHFLNPFFGVAVAALLLGEPLGWGDALGVAVIAGGILAVQLSRSGEQRQK